MYVCVCMCGVCAEQYLGFFLLTPAALIFPSSYRASRKLMHSSITFTGLFSIGCTISFFLYVTSTVFFSAAVSSFSPLLSFPEKARELEKLNITSTTGFQKCINVEMKCTSFTDLHFFPVNK